MTSFPTVDRPSIIGGHWTVDSEEWFSQSRDSELDSKLRRKYRNSCILRHLHCCLRHDQEHESNFALRRMIFLYPIREYSRGLM